MTGKKPLPPEKAVTFTNKKNAMKKRHEEEMAQPAFSMKIFYTDTSWNHTGVAIGWY